MGKYTLEQLPIVVENIEDKLDVIKEFLFQEKLKSSDGEQFMNVKQTSVLLNLAVSTIYSKISRNEIPVIKKGKKLYFIKEDLMEWIKMGRRKTNIDFVQSLSNKKRA